MTKAGQIMDCVRITQQVLAVLSSAEPFLHHQVNSPEELRSIERFYRSLITAPQWPQELVWMPGRHLQQQRLFEAPPPLTRSPDGRGFSFLSVSKQIIGGEPGVGSLSAGEIDQVPIGPGSVITELLANWDDFQLLQLTDFYRARLEQAMERGVHGVSLALTAENQFSGEEHRKISDLADKGERADSSKLLLSLVMEKGSRARRVMWETFVKMRIGVPKLDKILKEIQEHGCVPVHQPIPEIPSELKGK
ncbi:uncharacterized protein [Hemitrygon akajei]|uniref:uncharacterized protein n=1 Tax=Hemitrygon akajei TaxID=2704970 RepID=UPI003BF96231